MSHKDTGRYKKGELTRSSKSAWFQVLPMMEEFKSSWGNELQTLLQRRPLSGPEEEQLEKIEKCMKSAYAMAYSLKELAGSEDEEFIQGELKYLVAKIKALKDAILQLHNSNSAKSSYIPLTHPNKRENLPKDARVRLKQFLETKLEYPYPSDAEKKELARETGVREDQVTNWFINARVRYWKPQVEARGWEIWQNEQGYWCSGPSGQGSAF